MREHSVYRYLLPLFLGAVWLVAVLGGGMLCDIGLGFRSRSPLWLPALWLVEALLYSLVVGASVRGRPNWSLAVLLGMIGRATMAAAAATLWRVEATWCAGFATFYYRYPPGALLQMVAACMCLWMMADKLALPAGPEAARSKPEPAAAEGQEAGEAPSLRELLAELLPERREGKPDEETAEMPPVSAEQVAAAEAAEPAAKETRGQGTAPAVDVSELMAEAVAEAASSAAGVEVRPVGADIKLLTNLCVESPEAAARAHEFGAALRAACEEALMGAPTWALASSRTAAASIVATSAGMCVVSSASGAPLGALAQQARLLAEQVGGQWPQAAGELPSARPSDAPGAVEAAELGGRVAGFVVEGVGTVVVVVPASCDAARVASAAGAAWRSLAGLLRLGGLTAPVKLLVSCSRGTLFVGQCTAASGEARLLVMAAADKPPGPAAIEGERLLGRLCRD